MIKISFILFILFFISSCSEQMDLNQQKVYFDTHQDSYELLVKMVKEDFKGPDCFSVGTDNIGNYWEFSGEWSHNQSFQDKMSTSEVLLNSGISTAKYSDYLELFDKTQTERITFCPPSTYYILAHRSGLGVSGCLLDIVKGVNPPLKYGKPNNGEDFMEVIILKTGWWMEYRCT